MSHIVFATPAVCSFHLHERLHRELLRREHRVSVLCADDAAGTFWSGQAGAAGPLPVHRLGAGTAGPRRGDLRDAAARWLDDLRPDVVVFHGRHPAQAAIQLAARAAGCHVLWTGAGLLPHTLQADPLGLDADASSQRWRARDFRVVTPDEPLLRACLTHALASQRPFGLPRAPVRAPGRGQRAAAAARAALAGDVAGAWRAWRCWREALEPPSEAMPSWTADEREALARPFVALLLPSATEQRTWRVGPGVPRIHELLRQTRAAADAHGARAVAILPADLNGARRRETLALAERAGVHLLPDRAAAIAAATAAAVVTVNHPAAAVALLAGTPVVHTSGALYGLEGVTRHVAAPALGAAVADAIDRDRPALRRRFLTWLMRYGHVWCSPTEPSYNGLLGLAERIERAIQAREGAPERCHQPGPGWPLASPV